MTQDVPFCQPLAPVQSRCPRTTEGHGRRQGNKDGCALWRGRSGPLFFLALVSNAPTQEGAQNSKANEPPYARPDPRDDSRCSGEDLLAIFLGNPVPPLRIGSPALDRGAKAPWPRQNDRSWSRSFRSAHGRLWHRTLCPHRRYSTPGAIVDALAFVLDLLDGNGVDSSRSQHRCQETFGVGGDASRRDVLLLCDDDLVPPDRGHGCQSVRLGGSPKRGRVQQRE